MQSGSPDGASAFEPEWTHLRGSLQRLGEWWSDAKAPPFDPADEPVTRFEPELQAVYERALRDVVAKRVGAPELLRSPWSEMSVEAAVDALADRAAEAGDWERSLKLLKSLPHRTELRSRNEKIEAIQAYFTGLSFEQARRFSDAVDSYYTALQQIAEHTPIREAGARLTALREKHPQAFERAEPPAEP
jgi:hypothetical protein